MFDNVYNQDIEYSEYIVLSQTGGASLKEPVTIKGLRLKGQLKVSTNSDGETTSCSIVYKTPIRIIPNSELNGRAVMECVKVSGFGLNCGYISYVK